MAEAGSSLSPVPAGPDLSLPFNINETLGVTFIGFTFSTILYGVSSAQIYVYFQKGANEQRVTKALVFLLWLLETVWMIFWAITLYRIFITNYMNLSASLRVPWSLQVCYIAGVVSNGIVIGIYTHRLWRLGGRYVYVFVAIQVAMQLPNCAFGIAYPFLVDVHDFLQLGTEFGWIYYIEFVCSTLGSISIAISLCSTLWTMRTGVRRTDSLIWLIMKYSISTCLLTSLVNIAAIVALAAGPTTLIYVAVDSIQPKIVLNSMLAFLNSRESFQRVTTGPVSIHLSKLHPPCDSTGTPASASTASGISEAKGVESADRISGITGEAV